MITAPELTRRETLLYGAAALASTIARPALAQAQEGPERHGMSAFGDLKYRPDFKHFDYVNPNAPKGGVFSHVGATRTFNQNFLTFNSLNSFIHDSSPLTAHDVAFSLKVLKDKGHPIAQQLLRDLVDAEARDDATMVVRFAPYRARDVPLFAASLPIFSRSYYSKRPFDETTLEVPLGSGPYKVGRFEPGRHIEYERVKDWWGADLPVARGQNNFDIVRYEYYRDRDVAFEGFTAKSYLFREEFTSRTWATRYDFPALRDGRIKRYVISDDTPSGALGWFFNTRREKFKEKRLREAFIDAFDFEWTNKNIMYGSYQRTQSVFQNSDMMAIGKPSADELARPAGFRWIGSGSYAAAQGQRTLAAGWLRHQGRKAGDAEGRTDQRRVLA